MSIFNVLLQAEITGDLSVQTDLTLIPTQVLLARLETLHRLQRDANDKSLNRDAILHHLAELTARQSQA